MGAAAAGAATRKWMVHCGCCTMVLCCVLGWWWWCRCMTGGMPLTLTDEDETQIISMAQQIASSHTQTNREPSSSPSLSTTSNSRFARSNLPTPTTPHRPCCTLALTHAYGQGDGAEGDEYLFPTLRHHRHPRCTGLFLVSAKELRQDSSQSPVHPHCGHYVPAPLPCHFVARFSPVPPWVRLAISLPTVCGDQLDAQLRNAHARDLLGRNHGVAVLRDEQPVWWCSMAHATRRVRARSHKSRLSTKPHCTTPHHTPHPPTYSGRTGCCQSSRGP